MRQQLSRTIENPLDWVEELTVRTLLPAEALEQYRQGDISDRLLAPHADALGDLSTGYVARAPGILTEAAAAAYALYYLPINLAKVQHLLPNISSRKSPAILDYGCGPGTASLAAYRFWGPSMSITAVDAAAGMRRVAERLLKNLAPAPTFSVTEVEAAWTATYDVIFLCNVLNEIAPPARRKLLSRAVGCLNPGGALVIIEPGAQEITRELMQHRDEILSDFRDLVPRYPCTRSDACPMLRASATDWCHGEFRWETPRIVRQLDRLLSFNKHRIKFAALILEKGAPLIEGLRVVGISHRSKRGTFVPVCGPSCFGPRLFGRSTKIKPKSARLHDLIVPARIVDDPD